MGLVALEGDGRWVCGREGTGGGVVGTGVDGWAGHGSPSDHARFPSSWSTLTEISPPSPSHLHLSVGPYRRLAGGIGAGGQEGTRRGFPKAHSWRFYWSNHFGDPCDLTVCLRPWKLRESSIMGGWFVVPKTLSLRSVRKDMSARTDVRMGSS